VGQASQPNPVYIILLTSESCLFDEKSSLVYYNAISLGKFMTPSSSHPIFQSRDVSDFPSFHTYDYARHFLSSCTRILGLETEPNGCEFEGRFAQVGTFPIGIDPHQFVEGLQRPTVQTRLKQLEKRFEGCKVIMGVDRLDYIKGIPQKLQALEIFLSQHPEWVGKVSQLWL
jgi:trehalose-6-phosphate synthase